MLLKIVIGIILLITYGLIFSGNVDWFDGFNKSQNLIFSGKSIGLAKAKTGIAFIYLMALASIYLISFTKEWHKNLLGYFLVFLTFSVLLAFE